MKVEAYRCDKCGLLKPAEHLTGILPVQDLFEKIKSYPIIVDPAKANIHFCIECYNSDVMEKARVIDRRVNEREYELKLLELSYNLKQTCVNNIISKKKFPVLF